MKNLILMLLIMVSVSVNCQNEILRDSIQHLSISINNRLNNEQLDNYLQLDKPSDFKISSFKPDFEPVAQKEYEQLKEYLPPIESYYYPTINVNPTNIYLPLGNNYSLSAAYPIADNVWVSTYSGSTEYLNMGGIRHVNANIGYQPTDWLSISGGPYVSKYVINTNFYNDYGFTGAMKLKATENIRFNLYGQYSGQAERNKIGGPMSSMFDQTYYGGTVEFKINDSFGIEAGMIREFDPFSGKWRNQPIIAPVFYGGRKKK